MPRILIADDDRELCTLLADYLGREGFEVETAHDAPSAAMMLQDPARLPDLLILDVMMPGESGLDALRELRRRHDLPVIMLSARGEPVDRVIGLELGADDYIAKPCLPRELLARVRARLRRSAAVPDETVVAGLLRLVPGERRAWIGEAELKLTGAEYALLLALARKPGHAIDKATLTRIALGRPIERFDRSIDVHVSRVRRKLAQASPRAPTIEAVRGSGYLLVRPRA